MRRNLQNKQAITTLLLCCWSAIAWAQGASQPDEHDFVDLRQSKSSVAESSGSFQTSLSIEVPTFPGVEPGLGLSHRSGGGNSWVGVGWSLSGLSVIERAGLGKGAPTYTASDIYLLDGEELAKCPTSGATSPSCLNPDVSANSTYYFTKHESYRRIRFDNHATPSNYTDDFWEITGKSGTKTKYTAIYNTGSSPVYTWRWGIATVTDTTVSGNVTTYTWDVTKGRPSSISYGGYSILFSWQPSRPDPYKIATGLGFLSVTERLVTVEVKAGTNKIRAYKLAYNPVDATSYGVGRFRSELASVTQYGKDYTYVAPNITGSTTPPLPAVTMTYQPSTRGLTAGTTWSTGGDGDDLSPTFVGDFDGDGKSDIMDVHVNDWRVKLSTGAAFTTIQTAKDWGWHQQSGDFDGDGKTDLIDYEPADLKWHLKHSSGSGLNETLIPAGSGFNKDHLEFGTLFTADVNADGATDLIYYYTEGVTSEPDTGWYVCLGLPSPPYMAGCSNWGPGFVKGESDTRIIGDFDGDGMSDILLHKPDGWKVYRSTGAAFEPAVIVSTAGVGSSRIMGGDFNGDGKSDMMRYSANGWEVFLSNGKTFAAAAPWSTHGSCNIPQGGDFNGDGLTDFICKDTISAADLFVVCYSLGDSFNCFNTTGTEVGDKHRLTGDFDGDGATDIAYYRNTQTDWRVRLSITKPQLLTMVSNGIGGTTTVTYASSSDTNVVTSNVHNPPLRKVVKQVAESDGRNPAATTSYVYTGGYYDDAEREYVGFRMVTKNLPCVNGDCPRTEQYFVNGTDGTQVTTDPTYPACSGQSDYLDLFDSANKRRSRTNAVYTGVRYTLDVNGNVLTPSTCVETGHWQVVYDGSGTTCVAPAGCSSWDTCSTQSVCASAKRTYSSSLYDGFGNVTLAYTYGDYDTNGDEKTTTTAFYPNSTAFIVGAVADSRVYAGLGTTTLIQESLTFYDAACAPVTQALCPAGALTTPPSKGFATRSEVWESVSNSYLATSKTEYDSLGNVTAGYDALNNKSSSYYDSSSHVTKLTNALGHATTSLYDAIGQLTRGTDPNGVTSDRLYDALGRVTRTNLPGGDYAITSGYDTLGNATAQYIQTSTPPPAGVTGDLWSRRYFDGQGRVYKATSRGPSSADITVETLWDARGRTTSTCAPYYAGGTKYWSSTAYDALDRVTKLTGPDGTSTSSSYNLWSTTTTDSLGHQTIATADASGKVVSYVEKSAAGATAYAINYAYDLRGNPTQTSYLGSGVTPLYSTSYTVNSLGWKLAMTDADMGSWSYGYDAMGRLTSQVDGMGQLQVQSFDAMGRVTQRQNATRTVTWTYDQGTNGIGRLRTASYPAPSGGTDAATIEYDVAGRATRRTLTIDGTAYSSTGFFDLVGRVTKTVFPDGEILTGAGYDAAGRMTSMPNVGSGSIVLNALYDAAGRATFVKNGNGTETTQSFDSLGRLTRTKSYNSTTPTTVYLDLSYARDTESKITQVTGALAGQTAGESWSYQYDWQHQLTKATTNGTDVQTLAYTTSRDGNIATNSRMAGGAAYTYGSSRPHAVTAVGAMAYGYDGNGNMVNWGGRSITFDAENMPTSITGTSNASFSYDGDGGRVRKIYGGVETRYLGDDYEIAVASGLVTKYLSACGMRVAKRVGTTTTWLHTDGQGSIRAATNASAVEQGRKKYWPFGESYSSTLSDSMGYTGQRQDETGLIYLHARYYDPQLGRFTSADTLIPGATIGNLNRYAYTNNNPVNGTDPSGHACVIEDKAGSYGDPCASLRILGLMDTGAESAEVVRTSLSGRTVADFLPGSAELLHSFGPGVSGLVDASFNVLGFSPPKEGGGLSEYFNSGDGDADARHVIDRMGLHLGLGGLTVQHTQIQGFSGGALAATRAFQLLANAGYDGPAIHGEFWSPPSAIDLLGLHYVGGNGPRAGMLTTTVHFNDKISATYWLNPADPTIWGYLPGSPFLDPRIGGAGRSSLQRIGQALSYNFVADAHVNRDNYSGKVFTPPFAEPILANLPRPVTKEDQQMAAHAASERAETPRPTPTPSTGGGCFVAGTPVLMADGTSKAIDEMQVGDVVLAYDEKLGRMTASEVTHVFVHENWRDRAQTVLVNGHLRATTNHPFFVDGGWARAEDLKEGMVLYRVSDLLIGGPVSSMATIPNEIVSLEQLPGVDTVYNLEVATYHTYFADGILVHNAVLK